MPPVLPPPWEGRALLASCTLSPGLWDFERESRTQGARPGVLALPRAACQSFADQCLSNEDDLGKGEG